tara:strand:+ start:396 stop:1139 length:744 start_codon:yes stop_codon:yes gene_type:complete
MKYFSKIIFTLISINYLLGHGVSESTVTAMSNANLMDFVYFGGEHMVTGYDHILFLIGVLFFLTNYFDILKFITAFTIAHCLTLIFATYFQITANAYLIDAVIAFSVIYKGFENLDGFKKIFSTKAPNLLLMVFIFGLIHGFGLSTKLQEVAVASNINLSVSQILSFNVGVEFGQIIVLLILYPILSLLRGDYFNLISKATNWALIFLGFALLIMQLNGFFHDMSHNDELEIHNHNHNHKHEHNHNH